MTGDFVTRVPAFGARNEGAICFTADTTAETWLWNYNPEAKEQSAVWKRSGSPPTVKAQVSKSGDKTMFIMFADIRGMTLLQAVLKGATENARYYTFIVR